VDASLISAHFASAIFYWPVDGGGNLARKLEEISCGVRIVLRGTISVLAALSEFTVTFQAHCSTWNIGGGGRWKWTDWPLFHVEQYLVNGDILQ
jgi:hypothetical protein